MDRFGRCGAGNQCSQPELPTHSNEPDNLCTFVSAPLKWPVALPLLAAALFLAADGHKGGDVADGAEAAIIFAYAKGAARACEARTAGAKAAKRRAEIARQGAPAALQALLDDDSLGL